MIAIFTVIYYKEYIISIADSYKLSKNFRYIMKIYNSMSELEVKIVPWVLPNEHIPISITWREKQKDDQIQIIINNRFTINEILSGKIIKEITKDDNKILYITPSFIQNKEALGYLGIILSYTQIPTEQMMSFKFKTILIQKSKPQKSNSSYIMIFRPSLELKELKVIQNKLGIELIHRGFGDIEIKVEGRVEGKIVTHNRNILRRALMQYQNDKNIKSGIKNKNISKKNLQKTKEMIENTLIEMFPEENISENDISDIEKLFLIIQPYLINIMDELSNTQLSPAARVSDDAEVKYTDLIKVDHFSIIIYYRDLLLNKYEPIEIPISSNILKQINSADEILIKVTKIKNEIMLNVANIGGNKK